MNLGIETIFLKFLKFGIVGFSGVIVDFGITYFCKEKLRIQKFVSNAIGFCVAASSNYILNRLWTFQSTNHHTIRCIEKNIGMSFTVSY